MSPKRYVVAIIAIAVALWASTSAIATSEQGLPSVKVPQSPSVTGKLTISFHPRERLPSGGYYYAVVVLNTYYAENLSSAECAKTSNMAATEYGYPKAGESVDLELSPEGAQPENSLRWCSGATYMGAIYAVPHAPPCPSYEPCYSHSTAPECYEGEPRCDEGKLVPNRGKIPHRREVPGQLPEPQDSSSRIVAEFQVHFEARNARPVIVNVPRHPSAATKLAISFIPREALHNGGYYYAVMVLNKHYSEHRSIAECAAISDMSYTEYAYPEPGRPVRLTLAPYAFQSKQFPEGTPAIWCSGATYNGGIYAVPHAVPCNRGRGPCSGPECYEGEPLCFDGRQAHGIIAFGRRTPRGALPKPRDRSVRLIARFHVHF